MVQMKSAVPPFFHNKTGKRGSLTQSLGEFSQKAHSACEAVTTIPLNTVKCRKASIRVCNYRKLYVFSENNGSFNSTVVAMRSVPLLSNLKLYDYIFIKFHEYSNLSTQVTHDHKFKIVNLKIEIVN